MAYRKVSKAKKYSGIFEYFNPKDKITKAYYLRYRDEFGEGKMRKLNATNKEAAITEANAIRENTRREAIALKQDSEKFERAKRNKKLTLNDVAKEFFEQRKVKSNTRDKSVYKLRLENTLGEKLASDITKEDLENLQEKLAKEKKPLANKTINATIDFALNILNYATKKGYIDFVVGNRLPTDIDRFIKKLDLPSKRGRSFEAEELDRLFDVLKNGDIELGLKPNTQLFLLCKLLYFTGARPEAILNLQVKQYDRKKREITVKAMKGISSYQQPLTSEAMELIEAWIKKYDLGYEDYLFFAMKIYLAEGDSTFANRVNYESIRGSARIYFDKLFNVGIPSYARLDRIGLYSLRRTGATRIYKVKGLVAASNFLHHTDVKTTMRYLDLKDDVEDSINVL